VSVSYEARDKVWVDGGGGGGAAGGGRGGGLKLTVVDAVEVYVASDGGTGDPGD
jgi:hypothetical protein